MEMVYCDNCKKRTGHKRKIGIGTFIVTLLTYGLWIFTIPLYPKRCILCGERKHMGQSARW